MLSTVVKKLKKEVHSELWSLKGSVLGVVVVFSVLTLLAVFWGESQPNSASRVTRHSPTRDRVKSETSATTIGSTKLWSTRTRLSDNLPKGDRTVAPSRNLKDSKSKSKRQFPVSQKRTPQTGAETFSEWQSAIRSFPSLARPSSMKGPIRKLCGVVYCHSSVPRVLISSHHKTGCILTTKLMRVMEDACNCVSHKKNSIKPNIVAQVFGKLPNNTKRGQKFHEMEMGQVPEYKMYWKNEVAAKGYTHFHFNRKPVNTIVSGYLYHKSEKREPAANEPMVEARYHRIRIGLREPTDDLISERESQRWNDALKILWDNLLSARISNAKSDNDTAFVFPAFDALNAGSVQLTATQSQVSCAMSGVRGLNALIPDVSNDTRALFEAVHSSTKSARFKIKSLHKVNRNLPQSLGLALELTRYLNCEYWSQLSSHLTEHLLAEIFVDMMGITGDNDNTLKAAVASDETKSEVIRIDLDSVECDSLADSFLDAYNFKDTDANIEALMNSTAIYAGVERSDAKQLLVDARSAIHKKLVGKCDWKAMAATKPKQTHITRAKVDPKPLHRELVSANPQLCVLLKQMTVVMEMEWLYTDVC